MAEYVFKKDSAGIRKLLQSDGCLAVMQKFAQGRGDDARPFIGYDRAKVFVREKRR